MSEGEKKTLVRRLLDELRDGWHPATIEKYFSPGYRRHLTATSTPPAFGRRVAVSFVAIVRIVDGMASTSRTSYDRCAVPRQRPDGGKEKTDSGRQRRGWTRTSLNM
jgi:hypothetical protein